MSRARDLAKLGNTDVIAVNGTDVGFGTLDPKEKVNVVGVVSATSFYGDGSTLDGIASAGIGTALSDDKTKALNAIYYTNNELTLSTTSTIDPPDSGYIAYTQAPTLTIEDTKELIIADGDDLLVDVLGIATGTNVDYAARGNGVFGNIYVDNIESQGGQTSVNFPRGLVSSGVATFTSDVSIGGTLTYEDVKNVDSVGLITARTGIEVLAGGINVVGDIGLGAGKQTGSAGQLLTSGGAGADATWTTINAAPSVSGIASASIASGAPVMMNADGKLSAVGGTAAIRSSTCPFITPYSESPTEQSAIVYDTGNDQFIAVYHGTGTGANEIHAKVGSVNASTGVITWGSQQQLTPGGSENPGTPDAIWDTVNNRLLTLYRDAADSQKGYMIVSSVSGGTITSGTPVNVTANELNRFCMVQDPVEDKIIVFWEDGAASPTQGKAIVGEINAAGNSSSWTGEATYCSNRCFSPVASFYPGQNKVIVSFQHYSSSEKGAILACTVSGNIITFGTIQYYETNYRVTGSLSYDSNNQQMLVAWQSGTSPYNSKMRTATLSGTTFTFGATTIIRGVTGSSGSDGDPNIVFDPNSKKALIFWEDSTQGSGQVASAIVAMSGSAPTTLTQNAARLITNNSENASQYAASAGKMLSLDPDNHVMCYVFYDSETAQRGLRYYSERIGASNVNASNFVGFSQAAYTNGQTATVDVVGSTNTNQTGLTTATKYFVKNDGSLGSTADDPSVEAGLALSFTSLLIR